jgi:hypothetical protein
MGRDDFPKSVREKAAARVGLRCSNPSCQKLTSGPAADPARAINIGEAAHITAASAGGPRYDPSLSQAQRKSIDNAIWLCAACASLIDRDSGRFTVSVLRQWREQAEDTAARQLAAGSKFRPIAATEVVQELTVGQLVAVKAMEEEFGCHVETDLHIPAGEGWLHLDAAVVRGDDLIAIDIHEHHGTGVAYFQIEYLLELCGKLRFPRFQTCIIYLVVVSDGPDDTDAEVRSRLEKLAASSTVEFHIRLYRLNGLRAKFGI